MLLLYMLNLGMANYPVTGGYRQPEGKQVDPDARPLWSYAKSRVVIDPAVAQVITEVAQKQDAAPEQSEHLRQAELIHELELRNLAWDIAYMTRLNEVSAFLLVERSAKLLAIQRQNNDIIVAILASV